MLLSNNIITNNSASVLAKCNYGNFDLSYKSENYNKSGTIKNNTNITLTNLKYTDDGVKIKCWIKNIPDAISEITLKLLQLLLRNTNIIAGQFDISTQWQAFLNNGTNIDKGISFKKYNIYCGDKLINNNCTVFARYDIGKAIIFNTLQSNTMYKIECSVTDGINESNTIVLYVKTLFPYVRIYFNNQWHKAIPYINIDNIWRTAKANIYKNKKWYECSSN